MTVLTINHRSAEKDAQIQLCVSLFLSLRSDETSTPVSRLKAMLMEVDQRLAGIGLPPKDRMKVTMPLRRFAEEHLRVVPAGKGMAFFASKESFRTQELETEPKEAFVIDNCFQQLG